MKKIFLIGIIPLLILSSCKNENKEKEKAEVAKNTTTTTTMIPIYIGTYTKEEGHVDGQAEGIYTVFHQPETGKLEMGETVAKITNPSFVKTSGDNRNLYAVSELGPGDGPSGLVFSYKINDDHSLEENGSISTESFAPCYIAEDKSGQYVFVANYVGGVVMMYAKNADGSLKKQQKITLENPEKSNPHSVNISADNKYAYITDLGNDRIWIYTLNIEKGALEPHATPNIELPEGSGPRHFAFSKENNFAYSVNELNSTISAFGIEEEGTLSPIMNISSLPEDFTSKNSAADIHVHPSGKFLFVSNRGHNSIAAFKINKETGALENLGFTSTGGATPRHFAISPNGGFLLVANQDSNDIVSFKINAQTGNLESTGQKIDVKTPVCIEFPG